jgi:serine/threonine protein kinase
MTLLKTDLKLPETSIHDFARDLVIAMQYLHHHSIIYCDLKPSNILLDENGRLKLGGFGLSRRLSDINKASFAALPPVSTWPSPAALAALLLLLPTVLLQHAANRCSSKVPQAPCMPCLSIPALTATCPSFLLPTASH